MVTILSNCEISNCQILELKTNTKILKSVEQIRFLIKWLF